MLGVQRPARKTHRDDAEKPFWISFADLMTALMVLFLVTVGVALLDITQKASDAEREKREAQQEQQKWIEEAQQKQQKRIEEIDQILAQIKESAKDYPGIEVRGYSVEFGDRVRYRTRGHMLSSKQARLLRSFVPKILDAVRTPLGQKWFKLVLVEGFTDKRGTYIYNLNLSLQRSERVLCVLLESPKVVADALDYADRLMIRELFLVGGSSFNFLKDSLEGSRRIELKLEFLEIGEQRTAPRQTPLDDDTRCPLDS